jgi:hypothetical protein
LKLTTDVEQGKKNNKIAEKEESELDFDFDPTQEQIETNGYIKALESKELPNSNEIKQKKLIANTQKFLKLKFSVTEQIRKYNSTQKKKYRISEISAKIGYKSNETRVRNTIKFLIGKDAFQNYFEGDFGPKPKYKLEDIYHLANDIGLERHGTPGIITSRGAELFMRDINSGISPAHAKTEIWCQQENHPPFTPSIYKLSLERNWCRQCQADSRMKTYDEVLMIGMNNGYILDETAETFTNKMRNRKNRLPKDVRLYWKCISCETPKNYSYNNIQKATRTGTTGCKTCFSRSLEITKEHAEKMGKKKGLELDMTDEEFEAAKDEMRKQHRAPAHASLIWKRSKMQIPLTFNYVAYLMRNKRRYPKHKKYISKTGHPSSEGENHGRWVLQNIFNTSFDHTLFKDIVGKEIRINNETKKIHPRSHVDGYNTVYIKGKDFKIVYEFWESYFHKRAKIKEMDDFKLNVCKKKGLVSIILTDEQDPIDFPEIIAEQFKQQTKIEIKHQYQKKIDIFGLDQNNRN